MAAPFSDRPMLHAVARNLGVGAAIFLGGWVASFLHAPPVFSTALWPPAGLAMAAVLVCGYRVVPGVFLGALVIEVSLKFSGADLPVAWPLSTAIAAGLALQASLGAYLVKKHLGPSPELLELGSTWQFMLLAGPLSCLVNASVGVAALVLAGDLDVIEVPMTWLTWWLGDSFGVVIFAPLVLILLAKPRSVWASRVKSVLFPVLLAFLPVLGLHGLAGLGEKNEENAEFDRHVGFAASAVEKSIDKQIEMLFALRAFYYSNPEMTQQSFQQYSRDLLAFKKGIRGVSWNALVTGDQRKAFEEAIRDETGNSDFLIFDTEDSEDRVPAGERDKYVVVTYVEPLKDNRSVLGFDVYSTPHRKAAMDKAERIDMPVSTPPVKLVQQDEGYGALVLLPVFSKPGKGSASNGEKPALKGFMTLIVDIPRLLDAALGPLPLDGIKITVAGSGSQDPDIFYSAWFDGGDETRPMNNDSLPAEISRPLAIAGQTWSVRYSPSEAFQADHRPSWLILVTGMLFVSLAEIFFLVLSGRGMATERLVRQRTQALMNANEGIRQSELRLRALVEQSITGIYIFHSDKFVYANQRFCDIFGYTEQEILTTLKPTDVIDASDRKRASEMVDRRLSGEQASAHYVARGLRKGGETIWVEIHGSSMKIDGVPAVTGTVLDITQRRLAEKELEEWSRQLERRVLDRTSQIERANRELDSFTYSVSHDLRAPLRGIDGWSLALLEDYAGHLDDKGREYLATIRSETQRMGHLIDEMLTLARATRPEISTEQLDISELANKVARRLVKANKDRSIEFSIQPGITAEADSRLVDILLTNLFDNACKFTGTRADARIEFGQTMMPDPDTNEEKQVFFVRDNGVGFDMQFADKLFGAFQRLHSSKDFEGTGIGLATVQRIVHRHHGKIWARAKQGEGAEFFFTLGGL